MEIGRVAQIDNAKENYEIKTKQVSNVEEKVKTIQEDEYKKNASKDPASELNEVILDNIHHVFKRKSNWRIKLEVLYYTSTFFWIILSLDTIENQKIFL